MKIEVIKITDIVGNEENPRFIKKENFKKLVKSIKKFPEMLELRPIVINDENVVLGGNMRLKACIEAGLKEVPTIKAGELTEEQQREFIVKDNVGFGEWDWDILANEWDVDKLEEWGLDVPDITETEKLSKVEFEDIYYTPEKKPHLKLSDCLNLTKYNEKVKAIEESKLKKEQKEVLKMFAQRFIKIDFEYTADYYFYNATEEEKKVMERLRLVLCDSGVKGFIDDDLLRVHDLIQGWNDD